MNQTSEYAEDTTKRMIRIHLQAQAPCTFESILHWCSEQDPEFSVERTEWALQGLRAKGLVKLWDGLEGQFEYRY